jgi:hypothetical protein
LVTTDKGVVHGAFVDIDINKAGGERQTFKRVTLQDGYTTSFSATFNVYKEQYVQIIANIDSTSNFSNAINDPKYTNYVWNSALENIKWNQIDQSYNFGDSATFKNTINIAGQERP